MYIDRVPSMAQYYYLFLLVLSMFCYPQVATATTLHKNNYTDLESLLAFKSQLADPSGILASNWSTNNTSFCSWRGISCSSRRHRQRVTSIDLRHLPLQGTISPYLGNLSFLFSLVLIDCSLLGPIPDILGRLPRLEQLVLEKNSLSGSIPLSIYNMSSLTLFYAAINNLTGSFPSNNHSFIMLPRIQVISLSNNRFTGQIPSSFIAGSWDLQTFSLSGNNYIGDIPDELCRLPNLMTLYLGDNQLSGTIPACLGNLTNLEELDLSWNFHISGTIPWELGNLLNLQVLYLATNELSGPLPISLSNVSMLKLLDFANNKLTGHVPVRIAESMLVLDHFSLGNNQLTGGLDFIMSLSNCRILTYLELSENAFEGSLPDSIGNLSTKLGYFHTGQNQVTGSIPAGISNLSGLSSLDLSGNILTGEIPKELSRLKGIQIMNLSSNGLSGRIPVDFGYLGILTDLDLSDNALSGTIPDSLGNITILQSLNIVRNRLTSSIPQSLWMLSSLIKLKLSFNFLDAMFPLGGMEVLNTLDLSNNRFSGNISSALGELTMLSYLDLSNNSFHGPIPQAFAELINIEYMNLSHNLLSDDIPKPLANLRYIRRLDLSFNTLKGQIPKGKVFSNQSIVSLQGNQALCGAPQLGFPQCSEDVLTSNSAKSKHLFKYIILAVVASVLVFLAICTCFLIKFLRTRRARSPSITNDTPWLNYHKFISYHELVRATDNFSDANLLGRGMSSSVFKARFDDGMIAAVKVINLEIEGASESFDAECKALSTIRHRNLVKIISTCSNLGFKSLILQFIQNGSLERWLYSENFYLNLIQRIKIMVDVSLALEHLHHHHSHVVVHQDLKPSNVLLDENMVAYLGDFGIAKFLYGDSLATLSSTAPGTIGYMAPEYGSEGKISRKGDVYSFGILLLETFTGKKPTDAMFTGEPNLKQWVSRAHPDRVLEIVDHNILIDDPVGENTPEASTNIHECLSSLMELGLLCSKDSPKERIQMNDVVPRLQKIKMNYLAKFPAACIQRSFDLETESV